LHFAGGFAMMNGARPAIASTATREERRTNDVFDQCARDVHII